MNFEEKITKKIIGESPEQQYENSQKELSVGEIASNCSDMDKSDRNKKNSSVNEIIGKSEEEKERIKEHFAKMLSDQNWKELESMEIEKSEEEIRIINLVNEESNKLLEKYGLEKFDIKPENVHLLRASDFEKLFETESNKKFFRRSAFFTQEGQAIFVNQDKVSSKKEFARKKFHEFIHFKSFQNVAKNVENNRNIFPQAGIFLSMDGDGANGDIPKEYALDGSTLASVQRELRESNMNFFRSFNEAITEELAKRFQKNVLCKHSDLEEENELLDEFEEYEKKNNRKVDRNEIVSIKKVKFYSPDDNEEKIEYRKKEALYGTERIILNKLIKKLFQNNQDKFKDQEEVFDVFAKSVFTGNIVGEDSWGRLVDKTFGEGTLRELMKKDSSRGNLKDLHEFVHNLVGINQE